MTTPVDALLLNRSGLSYSQYFINYGSAWACGKNSDGQLGINSITNALSPTALSGHNWAVFGGAYNAAGAVKTDGTLWTCGDIDAPLGYSSGADVTVFTQVGSDTDWASVAFGENTAYGIKASTGALWAWGIGTSGQFGDGLSTSSTAPRSIGINVTQVAAGTSFAIVLKADGTLHSAGYNANGQLGLGHTTLTATFTQIGSVTTWVQVTCGQNFCLAIRADGTLWAWGEGAQYGTGLDSTTDALVPTQVGSDTDWAEVWCGQYHAIARKTTGAIYSWGQGGQGRLGHGDEVTKQVPTQIGSATDWVGVAASQLFSYAKTATTLYSTGFGADGALGHGDTSQLLSLTALTFDFASPNAPVSIEESAAAADATDTKLRGFTLSDNATGADLLVSSTFTHYLEAIGLADSIASATSTTSSLADSATLTDIIQQAINQIVADTANGADTLNLGAALTLVDIADAVATQTSTYNSVMLVAEMVATLEVFNGADGADIVEAGVLSDAYAARVAALVAVLESMQALDTNTALVHVMQSVTDTATGGEAVTSTGSVINALLSDVTLATIRLNIGGELFTGWVLNTDTLAPSEYQFADRQFNSACKHGSKYLMAAEDGIYEFTDDTGVETVMTYIKTGKTDFGSDLKKRIVNSYIVYSASGNMVLKVTTSEYGQLQTRNYKMVPPSNSETTDVRRFDIGRGIKSRYWQFELVGDGVDCDIDEIGMLPIVLSRRF